MTPAKNLLSCSLYDFAKEYDESTRRLFKTLR